MTNWESPIASNWRSIAFTIGCWRAGKAPTRPSRRPWPQQRTRPPSPRNPELLLFCPPLLQILADEHIDVAIEHPVHIADLHPRAHVLYHAIGLKDVGAD